mgnify:CR=1 FL=1
MDIAGGHGEDWGRGHARSRALAGGLSFALVYYTQPVYSQKVAVKSGDFKDLMLTTGRGDHGIIGQQVVSDHGIAPIVWIVIDRKNWDIPLFNKPEYQIQILFERSVASLNTMALRNSEEFLVPYRSLQSLRREIITSSLKTVDDVARSDGIKMMSWADLLNFVCTKRCRGTFGFFAVSRG